MPFLLPNQQCQSTEGKMTIRNQELPVAVMSERANLLYHLWTDFTALQWTLTAKPSTQLTHQQQNNCVKEYSSQ